MSRHKKLANQLRDWKQFERELKCLINEFKDFPTQRELRQINYSSMVRAIHHHGGFTTVRERMGYKPAKKESGYWQDKENIVKEVNFFFKEHPEHNTLPPQRILTKLGYASLCNAIGKNGGLVELRKSLNLDPGKVNVRRNQWKDMGFITQQAREFMEKHGFETLPPESVFRELGYTNLAIAITRHGGGVATFRKTLGVEKLKERPGTWKSLEFTVEYAKDWLAKHPQYRSLPCADVLSKRRESGLAQAISNYHGGFYKFRELLGEKQKVRARGVWKNLEYALQQAQELLQKENLAELPNETELRKRGYNSFVHAVRRHYGGLVRFQQLLIERGILVPRQQQLEDLLRGYVE